MSSSVYYLDYNSTGLLSNSVKALLKEGFDYYNPSSTHRLGKESSRLINEVRQYLYSLFDFKDSEYSLFFHSGATESISTFLKGPLLNYKDDYAFFYSKLDHACVKENAKVIKSFGGGIGMVEDAVALKSFNLANITAVNNETGRVADPSLIKKLKDQNIFVHIDASQLPFRITDWSKRFTGADYYTFSGHKFGALKGSGFSFVKKDAPFFPLLSGGGQENSMRSGTENVMAIISIKKALEDFQEVDVLQQTSLKKQFEKTLKDKFSSRIRFLDSEVERSSNTSLLFFEGMKSDFVQLLLSQHGIFVGLGPACSKGLMKPSEVLLSLGLTQLETKQTIRVSFPLDFSKENFSKVIDIFSKVLSSI